MNEMYPVIFEVNRHYWNMSDRINVAAPGAQMFLEYAKCTDSDT